MADATAKKALQSALCSENSLCSQNLQFLDLYVDDCQVAAWRASSSVYLWHEIAKESIRVQTLAYNSPLAVVAQGQSNQPWWIKGSEVLILYTAFDFLHPLTSKICSEKYCEHP